LTFKSPLEQFKLKLIYRIYNNFIDFSITNSSIIILISIIIIILITKLNNKIINKNTQFLEFGWIKGWGDIIIEKIYIFIEDMLNTQSLNKNKKYIPLLYSLFLFLLFNNILGLIPYSFTTTSHIIINITMSLSIIIGITIIGINKHLFHFFNLFIPSGLSKGPTKYIIPLIFSIEFISYLSRIISLSVRLTANMLSGHILLYLISFYSYKILFFFSFNTFFPILPTFLCSVGSILLLIPFLLLEFGIALIQSYVFTILTSTYIKDVEQLH
jgi:F-type H+-transporting ATPase subunit a